MYCPSVITENSHFNLPSVCIVVAFDMSFAEQNMLVIQISSGAELKMNDFLKFLSTSPSFRII